MTLSQNMPISSISFPLPPLSSLVRNRSSAPSAVQIRTPITRYEFIWTCICVYWPRNVSTTLVCVSEHKSLWALDKKHVVFLYKLCDSDSCLSPCASGDLGTCGFNSSVFIKSYPAVHLWVHVCEFQHVHESVYTVKASASLLSRISPCLLLTYLPPPNSPSHSSWGVITPSTWLPPHPPASELSEQTFHLPSIKYGLS